MASVAASSEPGPGLRFVYVNASEHGASGGHTALAIGADVYHFQHQSDGVFRLVREPWPAFRRRYNDFENRTLRVAHVELGEADRERVRARLAREHWIQSAQVRMQADLDREVAALRALGGEGRGIELRGAGLFSGSPGDVDGAALRASVEAALGAGFVREQRRFVERELALLRPEVRDVPAPLFAAGVYPPRAATWSRKLRELLTLRRALDVLLAAAPVDAASIVDPEAFEPEPQRIDVRERSGLVRMRGELEQAVCALLRSSRLDRGFPLLLAMARHRVVSDSLRTGRLLVLDPFPTSGPAVPTQRVAQLRDPLRALRSRSLARYRRVRGAVLPDGRAGEAAWSALENAAARHHELSRALDAGAPLRTAPGRLVPNRAAPVPIPALDVNPPRLAALLDGARRNASAGRRDLRAVHSYDLLSRNCATELLRVVARAFPSEDATARALGGWVRADEGFAFIPFAWFEKVRTRLRVSSIEVLPSYRLRGLDARYAREGRLRVYLEESNTLTSTLYPGSPGDEAFLLFTDDVTWPRPLYAVANGAWAIGATGVGLLAAPFDGASRLSRGVRGVVASLPELAFVNVRKGSFAASAATSLAQGTPAAEVR